MIYPNPDGTFTPSCYYDDAVGDVNAAIDKLEALKRNIEDGDVLEDDDRLDSIDEQIQNLQTVVDFDHLSLDSAIIR